MGFFKHLGNRLLGGKSIIPPSAPVAQNEGSERTQSAEEKAFNQMGVSYRNVLKTRKQLGLRITPGILEEAKKEIDRDLEYEGFDFSPDYQEVFDILVTKHQVNQNRQNGRFSNIQVAVYRYCEQELRQTRGSFLENDVIQLFHGSFKEAGYNKAKKLCIAQADFDLRKEYDVPRGEELKLDPRIVDEKRKEVWEQYWKRKQNQKPPSTFTSLAEEKKMGRL